MENIKAWVEPRTKDGKTAYEVINEIGRENLPYGINLPTARSMTQAQIDYENRAQRIVDYYDNLNS